jgi:hypothetical protein
MYLEQVSVNGGTPVTLASWVPGAGCGPVMVGPVLNATNVYWMFNPQTCNDTIATVPIGGGAQATLVPLTSPLRGPALYSDTLYWVTPDTCSDGGTGCGKVMSAPVTTDGGTSTTLASGQGGDHVAVDGTGVYWASSSNGTIMKLAAGGTPTSVGSAPGVTAAMALFNGSVYWLNSAGCADAGAACSSVMRAPVDGDGGAPTVLASGQSLLNVAGIAVDNSNVYWTTANGVMKVPVSGGSPIQVNPAQGGAIALDLTNIYWGSGGTIQKQAK